MSSNRLELGRRCYDCTANIEFNSLIELRNKQWSLRADNPIQYSFNQLVSGRVLDGVRDARIKRAHLGWDSLQSLAW